MTSPGLAESSHLRIKPPAFPAGDQEDVAGLVLGVDATILYFTLPMLLGKVTSRSSHPSWSSLNPVGLRVFDQQQVAEATSKPFPSPDFEISCTCLLSQKHLQNSGLTPMSALSLILTSHCFLFCLEALSPFIPQTVPFLSFTDHPSRSSCSLVCVHPSVMFMS